MNTPAGHWRLHRASGVLLALILGPVAAGAAFPKPDPEKRFPELKVYDAAGRPWRAAREGWEGARRRVREDPAWVNWLREERAAVESWAARHRDRVEWRCGWWHDFVSPQDGSRLIWTEEVPGEQVAFLSSESDPRVEITPKIFGGWVFTFRGTHASRLERAARLYRLTGDERHAAWAAEQLDYYARHYLEWGENRDGARLYWQTLDVATNLVPYATAVRMLGDYAAPERRAHWRQAFFQPQVDVLNRTRRDIHNISTWHRCAVMQVALVFDDAALWRQALEGEFGLRDQIARGITSDYLWYEQSFGYNSYVVRAVLTVFSTAGVYGRAGELAAEMSSAENLMLSPIYLRFPDGRAPNPADNAGSPVRVPDAGTLAAAYRVFPTTLGLAAAGGTRSWDTLLDPPAAPPVDRGIPRVARGTGTAPPPAAAAALPVVRSQNLESSRMAVLVDGGWHVFFHYGQLTRSHAQAEALNYAAFFGGTDITHDPGTVGYGSPLHREYYTRGLSHNVPLVNGEAEEPPQAGELLSWSDSPARVTARQPAYRKNAYAERTLAIVDGALVDTASVGSKAGPQRLGLALHLQGRLRAGPGFAAEPEFAMKRPAAFRHWRDVQRAKFGGRAELDVDCSGTLMRVTLEAPGDFTLWCGSAPDIPPRRRTGLYLELDSPATTATFTTRFLPRR